MVSASMQNEYRYVYKFFSDAELEWMTEVHK